VYLDPSDAKEEEVLAAIEETETLVEGVFLARDLVNERAINMYPEILAKEAKENLEDLGVDVKVFGRNKIEELGMEAFLAVSEGSDKEPQFIVMTYKDRKSTRLNSSHVSISYAVFCLKK